MNLFQCNRQISSKCYGRNLKTINFLYIVLLLTTFCDFNQLFNCDAFPQYGNFSMVKYERYRSTRLLNREIIPILLRKRSINFNVNSNNYKHTNKKLTHHLQLIN